MFSFTTCFAAFHLEQPPLCQRVFLQTNKSTSRFCKESIFKAPTGSKAKIWTKFGTNLAVCCVSEPGQTGAKMSQLVECFGL